MKDTTRLRAIVWGHVQGVFFRESMRQKAVEFGLLGWVRNLPDGGVEWMAEGREADLQALLAWCRAGGPPTARVDRVDVLDPLEGPLEQGFRILR